MSTSHQSMASLLECSICLGPFQDPRMLICLHSLCHKCLSDHIAHAGRNGQFQCPVCRKSLHIPGDGADGFPKNFFVNTYMDAHLVTDKGTGARSKTGQTRSGGHSCSNYEDGDDCMQPEQFCLECCEYYCKNCSRVHRRSRATRSHAQVTLDNLTDEMLRDTMSKLETPRCLKHKNEKLKLFCNTCESAVCYICSQTSHQSHTCREVSDVDEELKSEISQLMITLRGLIQDGKEKTVQINHKQQMVEHSSSTALQATKSVFQKVKQTLDEKVKEINQTICEITKDSESQTHVQSKNLTLHNELLESLYTFTDDLLKRGTVYNRLASIHEVRTRIEQFQGSPIASTDGTTGTDIPDLVVKHLDGLVMTQEVNLGGPGSTSGPILEMKTTCSIIQKATIQEKVPKTVGATAPRSEKPSQRHLVLVHWSLGGSLTETRRALGQHVRHFKSIIWCSGIRDDASWKAAIVSLDDYFRQVAFTR